MKRWMKALLIMIGIIAVIAIGGSLAVKSIEQSMSDLLETEVPDVNLAMVPDGTYRGEYDAFAVKVIVRVIVQGGVVSDIVLEEHRNGQGSSGEQIMANILEDQSLEIDTIAGATYSSKAILLAVADALIHQNEID
jgi:uncharacterized protein with FMN-binding domain